MPAPADDRQHNPFFARTHTPPRAHTRAHTNERTASHTTNTRTGSRPTEQHTHPAAPLHACALQQVRRRVDGKTEGRAAGQTCGGRYLRSGIAASASQLRIPARVAFRLRLGAQGAGSASIVRGPTKLTAALHASSMTGSGRSCAYVAARPITCCRVARRRRSPDAHRHHPRTPVLHPCAHNKFPRVPCAPITFRPIT